MVPEENGVINNALWVLAFLLIIGIFLAALYFGDGLK